MCLQAFAPDGWLRTGDIGCLDPVGRLWLLGRLKDVIKTGGENVQAGEVEAALVSHPSVAAAAVVGVSHARLGEQARQRVGFAASACKWTACDTAEHAVTDKWICLWPTSNVLQVAALVVLRPGWQWDGPGNRQHEAIDAGAMLCFAQYAVRVLRKCACCPTHMLTVLHPCTQARGKARCLWPLLMALGRTAGKRALQAISCHNCWQHSMCHCQPTAMARSSSAMCRPYCSACQEEQRMQSAGCKEVADFSSFDRLGML